MGGGDWLKRQNTFKKQPNIYVVLFIFNEILKLWLLGGGESVKESAVVNVFLITFLSGCLTLCVLKVRVSVQMAEQREGSCSPLQQTKTIIYSYVRPHRESSYLGLSTVKGPVWSLHGHTANQ